MAAAFPSNIKDFADKVPGQAILSSFMNEVQDEIEAIETELKKTTGSVVDHGGLAGTSDDDHLQYIKTPASAADNALVRFDGVGGRDVQSSGVVVSDSGSLTAAAVYETKPFVMRNSKVVITNPYSTKANVYKGQMHLHATGLTHAPNTPAAAVTAYKNTNPPYNFVSLTNHNEVTADPGVSGILFIPGCETTVVLKNAYSDIVQIGATNARTGLLKQATIDAMLDDGAFVHIAHPNWADHAETHERLALLNGYYALEVFNASVETLSAGTGYAENRWDELLTDGLKVLGVAVDDCHDVASAAFNKGWVQVFADTCTQAEILSSLKRGNFYSSSGANLTISVYNNVITATTGSAATITWIGKGGATLRTSAAHSTTDSYTIVGDELYVRIKVTRDSDSKYAWSNPIWVDLVSTESLQKGGVVRGNLLVANNKNGYGGSLSVIDNEPDGRTRLVSDAIVFGENRSVEGANAITFHTAIGNDYDSIIVAEGGTDAVDETKHNLEGTLKIRAKTLQLDGSFTGTNFVWKAWTPSEVGWTALPSGYYRYFLIDKMCFLTIYMSAGTSDATNATLTLPFTATTEQNFWGTCGYSMDNSTWLTAPSVWNINASGTTIIFNKALGSTNGWTASGTKRVICQAFYEIA